MAPCSDREMLGFERSEKTLLSIDGADQIATLHCTVADYYYFVEHLFVLFQNDVDAGLRAYAPFG